MRLTKEEILAKAEQAPRPLPSADQRKANVKARKEQRTTTAGPGWFNMPVAKMEDLDERTKADLRLLSLRSALDPKVRYRSNDRPGATPFFHVGTVVSDASGFYSDRIPKRQRGSTLVDTLLKDVQRKQYLKRKYEELQTRAMAGSRGQRQRKPWQKR